MMAGRKAVYLFETCVGASASRTVVRYARTRVERVLVRVSVVTCRRNGIDGDQLQVDRG
jgi:hypothetical protein